VHNNNSQSCNESATNTHLAQPEAGRLGAEGSRTSYLTPVRRARSCTPLLPILLLANDVSGHLRAGAATAHAFLGRIAPLTRAVRRPRISMGMPPVGQQTPGGRHLPQPPRSGSSRSGDLSCHRMLGFRRWFQQWPGIRGSPPRPRPTPCVPSGAHGLDMATRRDVASRLLATSRTWQQPDPARPPSWPTMSGGFTFIHNDVMSLQDESVELNRWSGFLLGRLGGVAAARCQRSRRWQQRARWYAGTPRRDWG
jgi:hypothetical protein